MTRSRADKPFGFLPNGELVEAITLAGRGAVRVRILT